METSYKYLTSIVCGDLATAGARLPHEELFAVRLLKAGYKTPFRNLTSAVSSDLATAGTSLVNVVSGDLGTAIISLPHEELFAFSFLKGAEKAFFLRANQHCMCRYGNHYNQTTTRGIVCS